MNKKNILISNLIACGLILSPSLINDKKINNAYAAENNIYEVTASTLNVRNGASTSNTVIGKLSKGSKVTVLSKSNGWAKINYNNGTAYCSADYLKLTTSNPSTSSGNKETTANVNMRTGAGTNYSIVLTIPKGKTVKVLSTSNGWDKVEYSGKTGYVSNQYLKTTTTPPIENPEIPPSTNVTNKESTANVNMRTGAGTNYSIVLTIPKGKTVKVLSTSNGWDKVEYSGKTGYVSNQYLKTITTTPPIENPETQVKNPIEFKVSNTSTAQSINIVSNSKVQYSHFYLDNPKRLVVDIKETQIKGGKDIVNTSINGSIMKLYRASYKNEDNSVRLVVEVDEKYNTSTTSFTQDANNLNIIFKGSDTPSEPSIPPTTTGKIYYTTASSLNVRSAGNSSAAILGSIPKDTAVDVLSINNGWAKINYKNGYGYVSENYILRVKSNATVNEKIDAVVKLAKEQLGKPYVYGATGPDSFDCSGFLYYIHQKGIGVTLPRISKDQAKYGKAINKNELQVGDLLFFDSTGDKVINHAGMYIGNGEWIHSPRTGDVVKITKMSDSYVTKYFVNARRVIQ